MQVEGRTLDGSIFQSWTTNLPKYTMSDGQGASVGLKVQGAQTCTAPPLLAVAESLVLVVGLFDPRAVFILERWITSRDHEQLGSNCPAVGPPEQGPPRPMRALRDIDSISQTESERWLW